MTTYVVNVANQTKSDFFNHFNPKNLTQFLTWQDGKNVIVNSVLGGVAFLPGYYIAANVTKVFHNWTSGLEKSWPTTYWGMSFASKTVGACLGAGVNFLLVRTIVPLPAPFAAEKAMALFSLVTVGTVFAQTILNNLPAQVQVPLWAPIGIFGAVSGCYPNSALYVAGGLGAIMGAQVVHMADPSRQNGARGNTKGGKEDLVQ